MAGRLPKRTTHPGTGPAQKGGAKPVGYGLNGNPFYNQAKYNASKSGRLHNTSQSGTNPVHQQPHVPMPGHPSQNATHYHGPSTTGTIKPGAVRAPRMK